MMTLAFWLWSVFVLFLGAAVGEWLVGERMRSERDREAAKLRRERAEESQRVLSMLQSAVMCMHAQGNVSRNVGDALQELMERKPSIMVDWHLITDAANGSGYMLVKSDPRERQGQTH